MTFAVLRQRLEKTSKAKTAAAEAALRAEQEKTARLHLGLVNIAEYANKLQPKINGLSLKIGDTDMGCFLSALRDYCHNVQSGPGTGRRYATSRDLVSSAKRWGIDFDRP